MAKRQKRDGDSTAKAKKKAKLSKQSLQQETNINDQEDLGSPTVQTVEAVEVEEQENEQNGTKEVTQEENTRAGNQQQPDAKGGNEQVAFKNKERVLLMSSRGVSFRFRHLMLDFVQLLPHCKKDVKLDVKKDKSEVTETAEMRGCTSAVVFEGRKRQDMYLWLAKFPMGPTIQCLSNNLHTMAELKLSGNHLKGSRPILSFHPDFDNQPHLQVLKEVFTQVFTTPKKHYKSKPFIDHTLVFSHADNRIWIRNYQIVTQPKADTKKPKMDELELIEVGPRVCLQIIKIYSGPFSGQILYENPYYVSPSKIRSEIKKRNKQNRYAERVKNKKERKERIQERQMPIDEINKVFKE